jgi:hypothetical protein
VLSGPQPPTPFPSGEGGRYCHNIALCSGHCIVIDIGYSDSRCRVTLKYLLRREWKSLRWFHSGCILFAGRELSKLLRSVAYVPTAASALRLLDAQQIVTIHSDPSRSRLAGTMSADAAIKETCAPLPSLAAVESVAQTNVTDGA